MRWHLLDWYGFVTFETEEEARRIQKEADIILKDKKLNIAPAIKKQEINPLATISAHKDSFSNLPTNRYLEEAIVGDWPKMMKFKAL
ncbi:hypothetical protein AVEN_259784-1 [Araneus ventricosus]|uniref:RRM domain-containing protein n=1 Tax=Araneus ventricosus TaxID=182803 RepID=A0A4Y2QMV8_ARAVE|nr:hypothetical protein AVEN_259784-1 [Araneus ventricosus]